MQHVSKKKKKRGLWPKLAIRHGQEQKREALARVQQHIATAPTECKVVGIG